MAGRRVPNKYRNTGTSGAANATCNCAANLFRTCAFQSHHQARFCYTPGSKKWGGFAKPLTSDHIELSPTLAAGLLLSGAANERQKR